MPKHYFCTVFKYCEIRFLCLKHEVNIILISSIIKFVLFDTLLAFDQGIETCYFELWKFTDSNNTQLLFEFFFSFIFCGCIYVG